MTARGIASGARPRSTGVPGRRAGRSTLLGQPLSGIHIVNVGNGTATVTGSRLAGPFGAPYRVEHGLLVNGGYDLRIPVTFRPARAGRAAGSYRFSWKDQAGIHTLTVPITGIGVK